MEAQRTIKNETCLEGKGIHTGKPCRVRFLPAGINSGINFIRTDLAGRPVISVSEFLAVNDKQDAPGRRSTIALRGSQVQTVEHMMAALSALSIDNINIEADNAELPALDGSAREFFTALKKAGSIAQDAPKKVIEIRDVLWCEEKESFLGIFPSPSFKISYMLDYPAPSIGRQCVSFEINEDTFEKEIAPARTFCMKEEAEALLKMGFGKGADLKNTLVMDRNGPLENTLRFPDECARHKVLDLIGDLYILGCPVRGRVIAIRSGHRLNLELARKIQNKYGGQR